MLVVRTFRSPICRVRVAKPLDEAECPAEIGGPLELELVDRCPFACRATLLYLRCAMMKHLPHGDMRFKYAEAVLVFLPFWSYSLSSCQVNQKHYAYGPLLVEREGWLSNGNYTNGSPHWAAKSHLYSP